MSELLKIPDLAVVLQVSRATAYQLVAEGRIASVRLGPRCIRIRREAIEEFLTTEERHGAAG